MCTGRQCRPLLGAAGPPCLNRSTWQASYSSKLCGAIWDQGLSPCPPPPFFLIIAISLGTSRVCALGNCASRVVRACLGCGASQNGYESPVLLLLGCVSLGKLLNFCEPQLPHLEIMRTENGDDNI